MKTKTFNDTIALSLLDSKEEFPVDLDCAFGWLGYSSKHKCLEFLSSNFVLGEDFTPSGVNSPKQVGRPSHKYCLTIECFKSVGMMAGTEQGKAIRKYFLQCEKIAKQKAAETLDADRAMYDQLKSRTKALPCPEISLRSRILRAVDNYVVLFKATHQQVWTAIYRDLKYTYHYDVSARVKGSDIKRSKLEQIEADGKLEELRSVASRVLGGEI